MAMLSCGKVSLIFQKEESQFLRALDTMNHNNVPYNFSSYFIHISLNSSILNCLFEPNVGSAAVINPLKPEGPEEEALFKLGEGQSCIFNEDFSGCLTEFY